MSLVDYAASSDEDEPETLTREEEIEQLKENPQKRRSFGVTSAAPSSAAPPNADTVRAQNRMQNSRKQVVTVSNQPSEVKLPDASFLLNSPAVPPAHLLNPMDHSSRVAAAMAEGAARKRDLPSANYPRRKVPKGTLPHPKNVPDTVGGRLVPPQLAGRSNVVTEDITKLFVRKQTNSSTE
ncbi:hypothetical protein ABFX02_02G116000 [Erythranthe guttata]